MTNKEVLNAIGVNDLRRFPSKITLKRDNSVLKMILKLPAIGLDNNSYNMQDNEAAFEAWCFIIKAKNNQAHETAPDCYPAITIELIVDGFSSDMAVEDNFKGHFGRFMYRILKFTQQYSWFKLDSELVKAKENFADFLAKNKFCNNEPSKEAEIDEEILLENGTESYVEKRLCDSDNKVKEILGKDGIKNRQLPVGLFKNSKSTANAVFTGKKSAIDFWLLDGDELNVYELKAGRKQAGTLTEIFFYSNYMRDVYWHKSIEGNKNVELIGTAKIDRGYDKLCKGITGITKITGWLLADEFHPAITESVLAVMNDNTVKEELQYKMKTYKIQIDIFPVNEK